MKKGMVTACLLAASLVAQICQAAITVEGTLKWKGAASGGSWNEPSNWEVTSGSLSVEALLLTSCKYDLSGLADGAELVNGTAGLKVGAIDFKTTNGGTVKLRGSKVYFMYDTEVNVGSGSTIEICTPHALSWSAPDYGPDKSATYLIVIGAGTVKFAPESEMWFYKREFQPCKTTTVAIGGGTSGACNFECMYFHQWNSSTLRIDGTVTIGSLYLSDATCSLNLNGNTLRVGGAESSSGKTTYAGRIYGDGRLEYSSGEQIELTGAVDTTGTIALYDGAVKLTPPTQAAKLEVQGAGKFRPTGSATIGGLSGDGATGGVEMPNGSTLTVGGVADAVFNGAVSGAANVVKTGTGNLTLAGANGWTGSTEVKAGVMTLKGPIARKGQLAYFGFEDASAFGKECGLKGYSLSAHVTDVASTPTATEGVVGSAIEFPVTKAGNCKFDRALPSVFNGGYRKGDPFSMDFWIRTTGNGGSGTPYVLGVGKWADRHQIAVMLNDASLVVCCMNWSLDDGADSPVLKWEGLFDGAWHHVAITYDDKALKVYADGELKKSKTMGGVLDLSDADSTLTVGNKDETNPGAHRFVGGLDELRLWRRALTAEEVAAACANKAPSAAESDPALALPDPVCHWAFDDADNPGKDSAGNADLEKNPNLAAEPTVVTKDGAFGKCLSKDSSMKLPAGRFPTRFPEGNAPFTVSVRLLPSQQGEQVDLMHWGDVSDLTKSFRLFVNGCPRSIYAACCGNGWLKTGRTHSSAENADAWKHYVVTYQGGTVTVYRDGKQMSQATGVTSALTTVSDMWLNCVPSHKSANVGYLDDVRVYDTAFSKDEVLALSRSLATGRVGQVIPAEATVAVDSGATLMAAAGRTDVKSLSGAGAVNVAGGSVLSVKDLSAFTGTAFGAGLLQLAGTAQAATIDCAVEISEGGVFVGDGGVTPCIESSGKVVVPESGRLTFDARFGGRIKQVIARGSELVLPASFDGWTCTLADGSETRAKFKTDGKEFYAWVSAPGLSVVVR